MPRLILYALGERLKGLVTTTLGLPCPSSHSVSGHRLPDTAGGFLAKDVKAPSFANLFQSHCPLSLGVQGPTPVLQCSAMQACGVQEYISLPVLSSAGIPELPLKLTAWLSESTGFSC